jgi:hypothetical protein
MNTNLPLCVVMRAETIARPTVVQSV